MKQVVVSDYRIIAVLCKKAFVERGASSWIDLVHPETGKSVIFRETLEEIRERYPTAEIVDIQEWLKARGD